MSQKLHYLKWETDAKIDAVTKHVNDIVDKGLEGISRIIITPSTTLDTLNSLPDAIYKLEKAGTYKFPNNLILIEGQAPNTVPEGYDIKVVKDKGIWKTASYVKYNITEINTLKEDIKELNKNITSELYNGDITAYIPYKDYTANTYTTSTGITENIYYDTRHVIDKTTKTLSKIKIYSALSGDVNIVFLNASTFSPIKTITKPIVSGINIISISPDDISFVNTSFVVAIQPHTTSLSLQATTITTARVIRAGTTVSEIVNYALAYETVYTYYNTGIKPKVLQMDNELYTKTSLSYLPSKDYITPSFTANTGSINSIYFDTRCYIKPSKCTVTVKCIKNGNINIVAVLESGVVKKSINKIVTEGINVLSVDFSDIVEACYIGINPIDSGLMLESNASITTAKVIREDNNFIGSINYALGYFLSIENDISILKRLDNLEVEIFIPKTFDIVKELNNKSRVYLPDYPINLDSQLNISSGKELIGVKGKSIINVKTTARYGINIDTSNDVELRNIKIKGIAPDTPVNSSLNPVMAGIIDSFQEAKDLNKIGLINGVSNPQSGIRLNGGERIVIQGCEISNFSEFGFHVSKTGKKYQYALNFLNNSLHNNYCGIKTDLEAERSFYTDNYVTLNQIGFYMDSGTNDIKGMSLNANRIGMVLSNGFNHAHGLISNIQITHNSLLDLLAYQIEFGQNFENSKFGFNASSQNIYLYQSKGIIFNFCQLVSFGSIVTDGVFPNDTTNSRNAFINCTSNTGNFTFGEINGGIAPYKKNLFTPNPSSNFNVL